MDLGHICVEAMGGHWLTPRFGFCVHAALLGMGRRGRGWKIWRREENRLGGSAEMEPHLGGVTLLAALAEECLRERAVGEPTALVLFHVDDHEGLLTASGTMAARVAMLTVARAAGAALQRQGDLLTRLDEGGFAVLLPATDLPGALRVAARLRWAILRLGIAHPAASSGLLTVSLGVAVEHGRLQNGGLQLLEMAEAALASAELAGPDGLAHAVTGDGQGAPLRPLAQTARVRAGRAPVVPINQVSAPGSRV